MPMNKKEIIESYEANNMDDEMAMICLFIFDLIYRNNSEIGKLWDDFSKEIKTGSRFFPKSQLLEMIKSVANTATRKLEKGLVLYRARLYNSSYEFAEKEIKKILPELQKKFPDEDLSEADLLYVERLDFLQRLVQEDGINEQIMKYKEDTKFYGYDSQNSDAPPKGTSSGRANAKNISFLYTSEESETAIMEVFPKLGQEVSVAEVQLTKDIKIFDFFNEPSDSLEMNDMTMNLGSLSYCFSQANYKDELEYLPTQYICEFIRELGFEGIRFSSSIRREGKNIVIFDVNENTKPYTILSSRVVRVSNISVECEQILPIKNNIS